MHLAVTHRLGTRHSVPFDAVLAKVITTIPSRPTGELPAATVKTELEGRPPYSSRASAFYPRCVCPTYAVPLPPCDGKSVITTRGGL